MNSLITIHTHEKGASTITPHISKVLTATNHATRLMSESRFNPGPSLTGDKGAIKRKRVYTMRPLALLGIERKHEYINPLIRYQVLLSRNKQTQMLFSYSSWQKTDSLFICKNTGIPSSIGSYLFFPRLSCCHTLLKMAEPTIMCVGEMKQAGTGSSS